jgi:streptogramin lyase
MMNILNPSKNENLFTSARLLLAGITLVGSLNAAPAPRYDVVVADSQATLYAVSLQTKHSVIIAQGDKLSSPYDVARKSDGNLVVSDTGSLRIIQVNPLTRQQTVLAEGSALGVPYGIDVDQHNNVIYVANSQAILCVAPDTGVVMTFAQGGLLQVPLDVAVGADGSLYVADALAGVIRINMATKEQTPLAQRPVVNTPTGITTDGSHTAYVVDGGSHSVIAVDTQTGASKPVSSGGNFVTPVGIALAAGAPMLVSDPDAFNLDGGVMTVAADGTQTMIIRGSGDLVNARGIALVPDFIDGKK